MYKKPYNILIIILLLLTLYGCSKEVVNKEHIIKNENLSPYIIVQAKTYNIYNFEDKLEETTRFNIFLNVDNITQDEKNIDYEFRAVNVLGEESKYKSISNLTLPFSSPIVTNTNIGGNGLDEFIYIINDGTDHNFYEKVMYITDKDIIKEGYPNELESDIVSLNFQISEDDEKYNMGVILDASEPLHIDMQSFLVSEDAMIYSFFGLYGYRTNEYSYNIENNYIYKDMNMKYLYLRLAYYDLDGNKTEVRARYLLEDLL